MRTVTIEEAKSRIGELLDAVEAGESVAILRDTRRVATLAPGIEAPTQRDPQAVAARLREITRNNRLDGLSIRDLVNEGRR